MDQKTKNKNKTKQTIRKFFNLKSAVKNYLTLYFCLFLLTEPVTVPLLEADVPKMWLFLIGNVITQYPLMIP